jgi:hypothetical protein
VYTDSIKYQWSWHLDCNLWLNNPVNC